MIAVGACFKDEFEYLIEWFSWYKLAGFNKFFIADNNSTDGTTALLEALSDYGLVDLIYQPPLTKDIQIAAYSKISEKAIGTKYLEILFVDADEFLTHESMIDGEEYRTLEKLLSIPDVRIVCINWRTFGSSGHKFNSKEPVIQRFNHCETDHEYSVNGHLKSVSKIAHHWHFRAHVAHSDEKELKIIDCNGNELTDFIYFEKGVPTRIPFGDIIPNAVAGPLRVNHYVIKSEQEYIEKKERRGDIQLGATTRGMDYFNRHDFKRSEFNFPFSKLDSLRSQMLEISNIIYSGSFGKKLKGNIDFSNSTSLSGWLLDENGDTDNLSVNIFVNGVFQGKALPGFHRPNLNVVDLGCIQGVLNTFCGFRYTHSKPLNFGDVVEIKVHANTYAFPNYSRIVIE